MMPAVDLPDVAVKSTLLRQRTLNRGWVEQFFVLSGTNILAYKHEVAKEPTAIFRCAGIECSVSECVDCSPGNYAFSLNIDGTVLHVAATSSAVQMKWLECLVAAGR
jgi:hypothetical protein